MELKRPTRKIHYTPRSARGLEMAYRNNAAHVVSKIWEVTSSDGSRSYTVSLDPIRCSCPDHQYRGVDCKHIIAAALDYVGC